ncbi:MAG TPA: phenylalanine--tRNA ligase subunit beta [Chthoniobacterales bacterium]|jgi:phenylalanyl-tRNA synthetase beta chain|nr:phenylalanine--tRNA ligase subunit beta [Chthoniobacterales bacterium]
MKFSVNWLREFVELPANVDELAELLTMGGVEIEGIEKRGANFEKVVVAQINASEQHPNADRLSVCQVDDGSGQPRQIVCGAKNYKVGDKVPLALPGAVLAGDIKIKPSKLRGVESEGMLCSPSELGLSEDSDGLLILSPDTKIGEPIASLFPEDTILDVEITPNRGDLLSHFGLARDIAALVGSSRRDDRGRRSAPSLPWAGSIEISAPDQCPFISFRRIDNVKVGPSPDWLRAKIESVGIRSINNIVDISNFVMVELGQPTHAFDADKLKGAINVRLARDGEKFLALDGKTYVLKPENLVIADQERAVGLAGVMGGEETGVSDTTKNILLEAAWFLPASVRRTARNLNLPSDASYRFERRVDPGMVLAASNRAAELMREIADAKPAAEIATAGKLPSPPSEVALRYAHVDELIGISILPTRVDEILRRFGLQPASSSKEQSSWKIPSHRFDLQRDVDLIEEILRAFGIANVPLRYRSSFTTESEADRNHDFEATVRSHLVGRGLSEARTSKLISKRAASLEGAVELRNPLSEDHAALRKSFFSPLLDVLERNVLAGAERVAMFELGRVFLPPDGKEERRLAVVLWGKLAPGTHWRSQDRSFDYFDLKGVIESVIGPATFKRAEHPDLVLAVEIFSNEQRVGFAGQVSSDRTKTLNSTRPVLFAELNLQAHSAGAPTFREIDKFPAITRDIAMIVPENLAHEKILTTILTANEPLLASVDLFDVFGGEQAKNFGAEKKSMAYALTYRDKTRTLTNEEITVVHAKIRERLQRELGVELRE